MKSEIRQHIVEILHYKGKAYGYDIYRIYKQIYPRVTLRSIYYHLRKGTELGEFKVVGIEKEKGEYSWGPEAEKIYYALGAHAKPAGDARVKAFLEKEGEA
ncbi:hypothetical protein HYS48_00075 [Candidatus Woesearchaeota archaeon]|nr:hypothetical protein [Candidatus Woesearchaeota archaeon]